MIGKHNGRKTAFDFINEKFIPCTIVVFFFTLFCLKRMSGEADEEVKARFRDLCRRIASIMQDSKRIQETLKQQKEELKSLREDLLIEMTRHGQTQLLVDNRFRFELTRSDQKKKKANQKQFMTALRKQLMDDQIEVVQRDAEQIALNEREPAELKLKITDVMQQAHSAFEGWTDAEIASQLLMLEQRRREREQSASSSHSFYPQTNSSNVSFTHGSLSAIQQI